MERRCFDCTIRSIDGDSFNVEGIASPFNKRSLNLGYEDYKVFEVMKPGAFKNAIERSDTIALFNHDPNFVLGRSSAGTLSLTETEAGLKALINTQREGAIKDLVLTPMQRGDIKGMSIGFTIDDMEIREVKEGDEVYLLREISRIGSLVDVSVVTFPAYPDTTVHTNDFQNAKNDVIKYITERQAKELVSIRLSEEADLYRQRQMNLKLKFGV